MKEKKIRASGRQTEEEDVCWLCRLGWIGSQALAANDKMLFSCNGSFRKHHSISVVTNFSFHKLRLSQD